ncbi:antibiotic biosynthesis monooxygenase family protein [Confluentibacter citreus]|uniref:antibiotic biosynthesis monooxygenase family protein n=1 Tax=Confluentibacter citreus TaxID=2007307 RepID=UPI000C28C347|nr:antibiotic biosynthesis monooxygenase [Confluentibacter citreus]
MEDFKPYYVVIFTSIQKDHIKGYNEMAEKLETLAKLQPGFLGMDSARNQIGITVSYWESLEDIKNWKQQNDHLQAQSKGIKDWYKWYSVKICKVEREYHFNSD